MNDSELARTPDAFDAVVRDTEASGFTMVSEPKVGALLAALAASKPGGRLLELGTGTGHGSAWLLSGMDETARLDTVDTDAQVVAIARRHLGSDTRVTFHVVDGAEFITQTPRGQFDLIYADAWPGKFSHLDEALALLKPGGLYVIDDLLPQPNWPEGHAPKVPALIGDIERRAEFVTVKLAWASGLMVVVRKNN
ncbi:MAG TPA: class I SAM-dependent methyltransferase [Vicinamibacterales bacterium]|nr:class I SAM-dependent methyltransferase [Vicinamibacterales bacterium]